MRVTILVAVAISVVALLTVASMLALPAVSHASEQSVRGMFGDRTFGRTLAPRPRTAFRSGIRRGPSGSFLGLERNNRFERSYSYARRTAPAPAVPAPQSNRPSIPTRPVPRFEPRATARPAPTRAQPQVRPARPADIWFRSRPTRGR